MLETVCLPTGRLHSDCDTAKKKKKTLLSCNKFVILKYITVNNNNSLVSPLGSLFIMNANQLSI